MGNTNIALLIKKKKIEAQKSYLHFHYLWKM